MARRPLLRQAGALAARDFAKHPVWVHCHVVDYDEPWYEETDEETFRPWLGGLPVSPLHAIFLVSAQFVFADGSTHAGFVTPASHPDDLATMQPHVFIGGECFGFWGGMPGVSAKIRLRFYRAVGGARAFPAAFAGKPNLTQGVAAGTVNGFYRREQGNAVLCSK
jgi:hypothetical protein